jgi:hypothetical protein
MRSVCTGPTNQFIGLGEAAVMVEAIVTEP